MINSLREAMVKSGLLDEVAAMRAEREARAKATAQIAVQLEKMSPAAWEEIATGRAPKFKARKPKRRTVVQEPEGYVAAVAEYEAIRGPIRSGTDASGREIIHVAGREIVVERKRQKAA